MNLLKRLSVVAIAFELACGGGIATAGILDLDFTSDGSGKAGGFGGGPPYGTVPGYTEFVVAELGPDPPAVTVNPSITVNNVTFAINGSVNAWPGNNGAVNPDRVRGDYLFFGATDGALGVTPRPMPWSVTGLSPSTEYILTFVHGNNGGTGRTLTVASGAATPITINGGPNTHIGQMFLTSDGAGAVTGTFEGGGGEGNLAALTINPIVIEGDANADGQVNGADFDLISQNLFTQQPYGSHGDLNFNGTVDFADFRIWKNLGDGAGSGVANLTAVPEPGSLVLVVLGMFVACIMRGHRKT